MKKIWGLSVAVAIVVIAIGLISNPIDSVELTEPSSTTDIWNARTPYVGDNSAVSNLLKMITLPEGLSHDSIKLYTAGEERGLEWILIDDDNLGYDETEFQRIALLLFASIENLEDMYFTTTNSFEKDITLHYDLNWSERILETNVKSYYGVSPEKLQDLIDLTASKLPLAKCSISKMGPNGEVLSEIVLRNPELAKTIVFDSMIKSTIFEGTSITELSDYYRIRMVYPDFDETHDYYAYLFNGTPVLQRGPNGTYSVMSGELYPKLVEIFK